MNNIPVIKKIILLIAIISMVFIGSSALYYDPPPVHADSLESRLKKATEAKDEKQLISAVAEVASAVSVIALVGLSAYGGFIMLTSQGNPEKLNEAREIITNAVLGFAFIAISVGLLLIIQSILGLDI